MYYGHFNISVVIYYISIYYKVYNNMNSPIFLTKMFFCLQKINVEMSKRRTLMTVRAY